MKQNLINDVLQEMIPFLNNAPAFANETFRRYVSGMLLYARTDEVVNEIVIEHFGSYIVSS